MKRLSKMMVATAVALLGVFASSAKDLFWEGTNGTWSVGGGGWKLANGTPTIFEEGDNVTFPTVDTEATVVVAMSGNIAVGDLIVNATNNYQLGWGSRANANLTSAHKLEKYGSGTLTLKHFAGSYTADWLIAEGTVQNSTECKTNLAPENTLYGDVSIHHTIQVGTGDPTKVPVFLTGNISGYQPVEPTNTPNITLVVDNASVKPNSYQHHNVWGPVVLRNGAVITGNHGLQKIYHIFNDDIHVERSLDDSPATKVPSIENYGVFWGLGEKKEISFYVDDITAPTKDDSDETTDLNVIAEICSAGMNKDWYDCTWHKRGRGTMEIRNGNYNGNVYIDEGTLVFSSGGLGNVKTNKTIYVNEGATLKCSVRNALCAEGDSEEPMITVVVTNATLMPNGYNCFGKLKIYGSSTLVGGSGYWGRGAFRFGSETTVETDDTFVFSVADNASPNGIRIGYEKDRYSEEVENGDGTTTTNKYGKVELCIKKAKAHTTHFADSVMNAAIYDIHDMNGPAQTSQTRHCGIIKTGQGVLAMTKANQYTYITDVREGGIWLTGSVASNVVVSSGAFVGGTGTIQSDLVIQEGGGFLVDATNTTAKLTVNGTLSLPRVGLIKLYNVETKNPSEIKYDALPLPMATTITGVDLIQERDWKVEVDGMTPRETRTLHVRFNYDDSGKVITDYSIYAEKSGLKIIVR